MKKACVWKYFKAILLFTCILWFGAGADVFAAPRLFTSRFSTNAPGDILMIGNTLLTCSGTGATCANTQNGTSPTSNSLQNMVFVDKDTSATTISSSSATLTLPATSTVLWAGLYWGAQSTNAARNTLSFATPNAAYQTITATQVDDITGGTLTPYSAFADVTNLVKAGGSGIYWGADIKATTGDDPGTIGYYAGWSLVVVIQDTDQPWRNLTVFDGFESVSSGDPVVRTVTGFLTPPSGTVTTRVGAIAYEGDNNIKGDFLQLNTTTLSNTLNPSNNFFNSSITRFGSAITAKDPNYVDQLGFDIDMVDASGAVANNATSANFTFGSTDDRYYPAVLTLLNDIFMPVVTGNVTKTVTDVNGGSLYPGDILEYTITVSNTGQDNSVKTVLTDPIPANTTYVPNSLQISAGANTGSKSDAAGDDQAEFASNQVVFRLGAGANTTTGGALAPAESTTIKFRVTVNNSTPGTTIVTNQATINFVGQTANVPGTAQSDGDSVITGDQPTNITVAPTSDLSISKTDGSSAYVPGAAITYTITVSNAGPNAVTGATISDSLPGNITGITWTCAASAGASCGTANGSGNINTTVDLTVGSTATFGVEGTVSAAATGTLENTATVIAPASVPDLNSANNSATDTDTANPTADLTITKTSEPDASYLPGEALNYTIRVTNPGPSDVGGVIVADTVPNSVTVSSWNCSVNGTGADCDTTTTGTGATGSTNTIALNSVALPAGTSLTITVTGTATLSATGDIQNTATVTPPTGVTCDTAPCTKTSTVTNTNSGAPVLTLSKQATPKTFVVGGTGQYSLLVSNSTGTSSTTGAITVTDTLPAGITLNGSPSGTDWNCSATSAPSTVNCVYTKALLPGANAPVITVPVKIANSASGSVTNIATVTGGGTTCSTASPCQDTLITNINTPTLIVTKSLQDDLIVGVPTQYLITIANTGTANTVAGGTVSDTIPTGLTISTLPTGCNANGQTVTCTIPAGMTSGGQPVTYAIPVTPQASSAGDSLTNLATVTGGGDPTCPTGTNCTSSTSDTVEAPQLLLDKTASPSTFLVGQPASYTLKVTNTGTAATTADATITDTLPDGLTIGSPLPSVCSVNGQTVSCMVAAGLAIDTSKSFIIPVTATLDLDNQSVSNTAAITGGGDPGCTTGTAIADLPARCQHQTTTPVAAPQLTLVKTNNPESFIVNQPASYILTVTNTGSVATTDNATITDTIPSLLTIGTLPSGCARNAQIVTCTIPAGLAPKGVKSFVIPVTPQAAANGQVFTNTATVTGGGDPVCPFEDYCSSSIDTVVNAPDVRVAKTATPSAFVVGQPAIYTLTVTNVGSAASIGTITVTDTLSTALTIGTLPAGCTRTGQTVVCTTNVSLSTSPPGNTISFEIPVTPQSLPAEGIINTARVEGGGDPICPSATSPTCFSTITTPVGAPLLAIDKKATPGTFAVGGVGQYDLLITNTGTASTFGSITVTDALPAGITATSTPSGVDWDCSQSTATTVTCVYTAPLLPKTSAPAITIPVHIAATVSGSSVTNIATVTGGGTVCSSATPCQNILQTGINTPLLQVKKIIEDALIVGVTTRYLITVSNTGSAATVAGGNVTDTIPTGLTIGTLPTACSANGQIIICSLPAGLATSASVTYAIPVTPQSSVKGANLANAATVSGGGDPTCPGAAHCTGTTSNTVESPELTLSKSAHPSTFIVGQAASYILSITNSGTAATTAEATITDVVPTGLTIGTLPSGCSPSGQTVICTVAAGLTPSSVATFTIPVTATVALNNQSASNQASVTGGGDPGCPTGTATLPPRCQSGSTNPVGAPQLMLAKTANPTAFVVNQPASYILTVTNTGAVATTTIATITDQIPSLLTLGTLPAGCSASGQTVTCTVAAGLAAKATASFTIPVTPQAGAADASFNNQATVTGGGDPVCPFATYCKGGVDTVVSAPDLRIKKTATPTAFVVGQPASYTLTVTNIGSAPSTGLITVTDTLAANLTIGALPSGCAKTGQTVICSSSTVLTAAGGSISFTIPVTVTTLTGTGLSNTAYIEGGGDPSCPSATNPNCSTTVTTPVVSKTGTADVQMTKTLVTPGPYTVGQLVTYKLVVRNNGPDAAGPIQITDTLTNLTISTVSGACTALPCSVPSLASGVTATVTITATINAAGAFNNVASATSPQTDPNPTNNVDNTGNGGTATPIATIADLQMTKTLVTAGPYKVGQALSYTLTIHNNGPSAAGPVQITDTPTNLTIRTISGACTVLPCTLTSLAAGATATINLTATINSIGPFNNVATATSPQTDPNTVNNADNSGNGGVTEGVIDIPFLSPLALLALLSILLAMAWSYSNRAVGGRTFT